MTAQLFGSRTRDGAARAFDRPLPVSRRTLRARAYLVLALVDSLMIGLGVAGANALRFGAIDHHQGWTLFVVLMPLTLATAINSRAYQATALGNWREGVGALLAAFYLAIATILFVSFYLKTSTDISRIMLTSVLLLSTVLLPLGRAAVGQWTDAVFAGVPMGRVLIVDGLEIACPPGVTQVDAAAVGLSPIVIEPILLDRLARILHDADEAVVAATVERREAWALALKGVNIRGEIVVPELDALGGVSATRFAGVMTMLVSTGPLRVRDQITKRLLDVALAGIALIFLAPLLATVALAIKLDSPGKVFFRQQRVGYKNRLFDVFKFRSMHSDDCDSDGTRSTARGDDRVTRVGRLIRATSIDELPQLINILHGEMSFVGPRPHALGSLAGDQLFWEVDPRYLDRHACKPGLTGLAQIRGFRGATHRREDLVKRLHADLEYLNGWSVLRDLSILLATVRVMVHRNAF